MNVKWQKRFMKIAKEISYWSKDPSSKIGCIAVDNNKRILSTGYNGIPSLIEDTSNILDVRENKLDYIIHAEPNCLLNALKNGVSVKNSVLFVYGLPICSNCANYIIQSEISKVYYCIDSNNNIEYWNNIFKEKSLHKFIEANIPVEEIFIDD